MTHKTRLVKLEKIEKKVNYIPYDWDALTRKVSLILYGTENIREVPEDIREAGRKLVKEILHEQTTDPINPA